MAKSISPKNPGNWAVGTGIFIILGIGLGFVLSKDMGGETVNSQILALGVGFVWAYILLQLVDLLGQGLALMGSPLPEGLDLANKSKVLSDAEGLKSSPVPFARSKSLLTAWGNGLSAAQVIELAAFQSSRDKVNAGIGLGFGALILFASGVSADSSLLVWLAALALALISLAKIGIVSKTDTVLEQGILSQLPGNLPNTAMTTEELASAIGSAIDQSFANYIPKPEELSAAIRGGVEEAGKNISDQGASVAKAMESAQSGFASSLSGAGKEAVENLSASLASQADRLERTSSSLTAQIEKLTEVELKIDSLINVQKSVDHTMQAVSSTQEFKDTLNALRTHIEQSDVVLKELSKPRSITLVQEDA